MIVGLSGRRAFAALQAEGQRSGRGPLRLVYRPSAGPETRVAFAIPRSVGGAVARNRTKRRILAVLRELDQAVATRPPPGDYLVRVSAPLDDWSPTQLRSAMLDLLAPWRTP